TCAPLSQPSFHLVEDYARLKFVGMKTGAAGRGSPDSSVGRGSPDPARPGIPTQAFVTTSHVRGSPDPPLPYRPVRAYPNLKLTFPIALDRIPGTDQL